MVTLVLFPVRRSARRGFCAPFRAGHAVVRFFLVYLRVMRAVSRFRHDFRVILPQPSEAAALGQPPWSRYGSS